MNPCFWKWRARVAILATFATFCPEPVYAHGGGGHGGGHSGGNHGGGTGRRVLIGDYDHYYGNRYFGGGGMPGL